MSVSESFTNIMYFCEKYVTYLREVAYILATIEHETAKTFLPVREGLNLSEKWRQKNLRYYPYYGRGFVQITWKRNYDIFAEIVKDELGIIVNNNDLDWVLDNRISAFICVYGMSNGIFTGRKLSDYIDRYKTDYYNARRVVNGIDKAQLILGYAQKWEQRLNGGSVKEFNRNKFKY